MENVKGYRTVETLRIQCNEAIQAGAALFAGMCGDEVDLDLLVAYLAARGFDGGVIVGDQEADGVLWFQEGTPREVWVFEAGDIPEVLLNGPGRNRLRDLAARGGQVSVVACEPPTVPPEFLDSSDEQEPQPAVATEPPAHPWPVILEHVAVRVARSRGPRLAAQFAAALNRALERHGGGMDGERVHAPQLPESTWRVIVEAACAPVVAIAGRAFTDRTIAASEREVAGGGDEAQSAQAAVGTEGEGTP
ncbi:MAG: hypothetical protein FJX73_01305 [Armatimonadetes bacterium]|nr:hypothetical protein [Armatimonadota bacterium]